VQDTRLAASFEVLTGL